MTSKIGCLGQLSRALLCIVLLLWAGKNVAAQSMGAAQQGPTLEAMFAELRTLRAEFLEYRIAIEAAKIPVLELSVREVQIRRLQLPEQQRQIADLQLPLGGNLTAEERSQAESVRAAMAAERFEKLRSDEASLAQRERELSETLRSQRELVNSLQMKLRRSTARSEVPVNP